MTLDSKEAYDLLKAGKRLRRPTWILDTTINLSFLDHGDIDDYDDEPITDDGSLIISVYRDGKFIKNYNNYALDLTYIDVMADDWEEMTSE